ncbi:MAG: 2-C-methyl-D-erythritol 4-phosphate cytidylyltransferase [Ilumatobacteraceae bacterium]
MSVWAIVTAGGSGQRLAVRSRSTWTSVGGAFLQRAIDAGPDRRRRSVSLPDTDLDPPAGGAPGRDPVAGGATRPDSVRNALAAVPGAATIIVVHGLSHPLAGPALVAAVVEAVRAGAAGAVPGLPVLDALKTVDGSGHVERTVDKTGVVQAQCPQAFAADVFRRAHAGSPEAAEDSELVEAVGGRVVVVPGDPANLHVATPRDLEIARYLAERC